MKANELRIGNYLQGQVVIQVKSIFSEDRVGIGSGDPYHVHAKKPFEPCLLPILITHEWLLRLGFKKQKNVFQDLYSKRCEKSRIYFSVYKSGDCPDYDEVSLKELDVWYSYEGNKHDLKIRYIHQLQNLYFAMTGEELTKK